VTVKGINDIKTTAPWMVKYFYNEKEAEAYTKSSRNKIKIKCPDCGRTKDNKVSISSIYYKKSISCICSDKTSYPEKFIFQY
jgi:hypothetical protein